MQIPRRRETRGALCSRAWAKARLRDSEPASISHADLHLPLTTDKRNLHPFYGAIAQGINFPRFALVWL